MRTLSRNTFLRTVTLTLALSCTFSFAESQEPTETTLKSVMQGLLEDSTAINRGIFLEDFSLIEESASRVADHPSPPMVTRKKLMMGLGLEMSNFKSYDSVVHNLAVDIGQAAKEKDMTNVVASYHKLLDGCLSCHEGFKSRVSKILE